MIVMKLSAKHQAQVALAVDRAVAQWAKDVSTPGQIVQALDKVLLFLRQNGAATRQAAHVASLGLVFGQQLVRDQGWCWRSASEDGSVNPAVVCREMVTACLVVDAATMLVTNSGYGSLAALYRSCSSGMPHPLVVTV
jgi:hypothetical protein